MTMQLQRQMPHLINAALAFSHKTHRGAEVLYDIL